MRIAPDWKDYAVIATGDGEKLERWGNFVLLRPIRKSFGARRNLSAPSAG